MFRHLTMTAFVMAALACAPVAGFAAEIGAGASPDAYQDRGTDQAIGALDARTRLGGYGSSVPGDDIGGRSPGGHHEFGEPYINPDRVIGRSRTGDRDSDQGRRFGGWDRDYRLGYGE